MSLPPRLAPVIMNSSETLSLGECRGGEAPEPALSRSPRAEGEGEVKGRGHRCPTLMVINLISRHLTPLVWFDKLTTSGVVTPLILSLSKEMSGRLVLTRVPTYFV